MELEQVEDTKMKIQIDSQPKIVQKFTDFTDAKDRGQVADLILELDEIRDELWTIWYQMKENAEIASFKEEK